MRAYLAIGSNARLGGAVLVRDAMAAALRLSPEALPYPMPDGRHASWLAPDGGTALLAWTNEPLHELLPDLLHAAGDGILGHTGYLADPSDLEKLAIASDLGEQVDRTAGCFAVFRAGPGGFEAATTLVRVDPVYVGQAPGLTLAGSRALLVHLVAEAARTGRDVPAPSFDVLGLHSIVRHGFFVSDDTPFSGVVALPGGSTIRWAGGQSTTVVRSAPTPAARHDDLTRDALDGLAGAIVGAVEPVRRHPERPELGLSGGRDSRMVAAGLHAAGIPFDASTRGFDDHPDAVVARFVARALGVERHRVWSSKTDPTRTRVVVEHPLERAHRVAWISEGMNSAYDDLAPFAGFRLAPRLSGSGGEIMRGGYLYDQASLAERDMRDRVERLFTSGGVYLSPDANERARQALEQWDAIAPADPAEELALLYLYYRAGRWLVGPRTSTVLNSSYYHPLLDNLVVRHATALPARARWNERAVHALITRLAPSLRDVPIEGRRWRYEQERPAMVRDILAWRRRYSVGGHRSGLARPFDWRIHHDAAFVAILRDAVLDGPPALFDLVRRDKAERLFTTAPVATPPIAWRLLTLSVLLSGGWRRGAWPSFGSVEVPIRT